MIKFDPKEHKYISNTNEEYTSVTTVIKRYKKPFDAIGISEKYAIKHPEKTAEEWREEWKRVGKETADYGTKIHAEIEAKTLLDPNCRVHKVEALDGTFTSIKDLKDLEPGIYPEMFIWSDKYMMAGMADKVVIKEKGNKKVVDITDYKTYKKVETKSFYNPKTKEWSCMLEPLHGLHDCNYNHAAIQLAIYAVFLEDMGYKVGKLIMQHIDRDGNIVDYPVPYSKFKLFANFLLLHYKVNGRND